MAVWNYCLFTLEKQICLQSCALNSHCFVIVHNLEFYPIISVQFRDVSASWEYVDLTASMKRSKSEEFAPDQEDFLKRRKAKSFYETVVSATSTNSEDDYMPPTAYDIDVNACGVDFLDVLQDTEEVLFHELSIHPPDMTGIGIHQFGSFFDSKKVSSNFRFLLAM